MRAEVEREDEGVMLDAAESPTEYPLTLQDPREVFDPKFLFLSFLFYARRVVKEEACLVAQAPFSEEQSRFCNETARGKTSEGLTGTGEEIRTLCRSWEMTGDPQTVVVCLDSGNLTSNRGENEPDSR